MTCVILFLMNLVPGLSLRADPREEEVGLDDGQLGEFAYDYVELSRDAAHVLLPGEDPAGSSSRAESGSFVGRGSVKGAAGTGAVVEKTH